MNDRGDPGTDGRTTSGLAAAFWDALRAAHDGARRVPLAPAVAELARACRAGANVFALGNGGSAATAGHFAADLVAAASACGARPHVNSLADNVARVTALSNDHGYAEVFAWPLLRAARPGDVVVLFSVSGASENVRRAAAAARERGAVTIGLFGAPRPGRPQAEVDHAVVVPSTDFAVVESVHNALEHLLSALTREQLAAGPAPDEP